MKKQDLTARQLAFVEEYSLGYSATEAARRAGYGARGSGVTATRLLRNANVLAEINLRRAANAERFAVSREAVITELLNAITFAKEQKNPAAMISGWREIAKLCGYYQPTKHEVRLTDGKPPMLRNLETMSDEELIAIVTQVG